MLKRVDCIGCVQLEITLCGCVPFGKLEETVTKINTMLTEYLEPDFTDDIIVDILRTTPTEQQ